MINTGCPKHVEGTKNRIKTLTRKACILLLYVTKLNHNARYKNLKIINILKSSRKVTFILVELS